jgi:hypothetical protein
MATGPEAYRMELAFFVYFAKDVSRLLRNM